MAPGHGPLSRRRTMVLSQQQKDFFFENGYLPYGPVLEGDRLKLLRCEYDSVFERA